MATRIKLLGESLPAAIFWPSVLVSAALWLVFLPASGWRVLGQSGNNSVALVSAASVSSTVAPDSIASLYGVGLAPHVEVAASLPLPLQLAGVMVLIGGQPAPLFFVAPGQINCLIPPELAPGQHPIVVRSGAGVVAQGTAHINAIAPGIFTANGGGSGRPAAQLLRVRNGSQLPIENLDHAPLDLGPENEQVYLLLYLTGLRRETNNVRVRLGNNELASLGPAASVPGYAGLDQVNVLIPRNLIGRGQINLSVVVAGLLLSNEVQLDLAGARSTAAPQVGSFEFAEVSVGEPIAITGSNFHPERAKNIVRIAGSEASVLEASSSRLRITVPYGAATGPVSIINERGEEGRSNAELRIKTSLSGFLEDTRHQPIRDVTVRLRGATASFQTLTDAEGLFSFKNLPNLGSLVEIEIDPSSATQPGALPFPKLLLKKRFFIGRDNFLDRIPLQQDGTLSVQVGAPTPATARAAARAPEQAGFARQIATGGVLFEVPSNAPVIFPDGATSGKLTMTLVADNRTPIPLPPTEYVSGVVQLTPFTTTLERGGKLSFPNPAGLAPGTPAKLYRFVSAVPGEPNRESSFIEEVAAQAQVSADGQYIETAAGAIRTTSYYFVSAPRKATTILGRVVDSDGRTPVRSALVISRGQTALTDGDGGFVLRQVLVNDGDRLAVDAGYLRPNGRVARGQISNVPAVVNGLTTLPAPIALTAEDNSRLPIVLAPSSLVVSEGEDRTVLLLAAHPDGGRLISLVPFGPAFATVIALSPDLYHLRLTPRLGDRSGDKPYSLRLIATDDRGQTATYEIEVAVNGRPLARQQTVSTTADQARNFTLVGDDPERLALEYIIVAIPANGRLNCNGPNCTYTPNPGFVGSDQLIFKVNDALADSADSTVTIFVTPPANRPPVLTVPGPQTVTATNPLSFTVTASDPDANQTLTISAIGRPANATFTQTSNSAAQFSWTPSATQVGSYPITFEVSDNGTPSLKDSKTVTITVSAPSNRPPVANAQTVTTNEDSPLNLTLTASDPDGNPLSYFIVNHPANGSLSGNGAARTYTPNLNFNGADSFTFRVNDGALDSNVATVSITINPVNDAPVLTVPGAQSVIAGQTLGFIVTASDVDSGQSLTLSALNLPSSASFTQTSATGGQFSWTPSAAQTGNYTVTFRATDNGNPALSDNKTVSLTVNAPANPAPALTSLSPNAATAGGAAFTLSVNGANFVNGSVVRWNGSDRATSLISGTQLTAQIPASDIANAGTASVTAFNPAPGGGASNTLIFTINPRCGYTLQPTSQAFNASAGTGSVMVTTSSGCAWTASSNASWLTITSGASGSGVGTVGYAVAANTGSSSRSGTLTIAGQPFNVTQTGAAGPIVVVNAASFATNSMLAPDSIVAVFGAFQTQNNQTYAAASTPLPTTLGGVRVAVNGVSAGLLFTATSQINCVIPAALAEGVATVVITNADGTTRTANVTLARVAPGIFSRSGAGQGAAFGQALRIKPDNTQSLENLANADNSPRPIDLGPETDQVYLLLHGTGLRNRNALTNVSVTLQGVPAQVSFAGPASEPFASGLGVGEDQINALIPRNLLGLGVVEVVVKVEGKTANTVTIAIGGALPPVRVTAISFEQSIDGELTTADQVQQLTDGTGRTYFFDAYRFTTTQANTTIAIDLRTRGAATLDPTVLLYRQNNSQLIQVGADDQTGGYGNGRVENNNALLLMVLPAAGNYVLFASSSTVQPNGVGSYTLRLRQNVLQSVAYGANLTNATIASTDIQTSAGTYLDAYWFAAAARDLVDITMNSSAFDALLILQANGGVPLTSDDNSGGGANARLRGQLELAGIYLILATPYEPNRTGAYTFTLNGQAGLVSDQEQAPPISGRTLVRPLGARTIQP